MGSSGDGTHKAIDGTVGGLVWVRRRNGSWWPGRILGLDELPESCLHTPGSGTPVKLLGREDASVDWYNLEKSKRIKAFRCGEYDDCIKKAMASASQLSKRAIKYARKENAIIHALELEARRAQAADLDTTGKLSSSEDDLDSSLELSQSSVSFEDQGYSAPNESKKDCETARSKRMRGLEDLGVLIAEKKEVMIKRKVVEQTTMVSVPVVSEELDSPSESAVLGFKSNINNFPFDFDSLFDVPLLSEEMNSAPAGLSTNFSETLQKSQEDGAGSQTSQSNQSVGVSDWRFKRKRNRRARKLDSDETYAHTFGGWSSRLPKSETYDFSHRKELPLPASGLMPMWKSNRSSGHNMCRIFRS